MSAGPGWAWVGLGMRAAHAAHWLEGGLPCGFAQVHAENHFASGGAWPRMLRQLAGHQAISLHAVGLGLGSAVGLDRAHLKRLAQWVRCVKPIRVSDHACFSRAYLPGLGQRPPPLRHAGDLLPLRRNPATLACLVANIQQAQEALGQALLIENISVALPPEGSEFSEAEFLNEVARRSGCGLLIDFNNLLVNALNAQAAWCALEPSASAHARRLGVYKDSGSLSSAAHEAAALEALLHNVSGSVRQQLRAYDASRVGEVHLAGFNWPGPQGPGVVVDDHGCAPSEAVWRLWQECMQAWGPRLTVLEWDTQLPAFQTLLELGQRAADTLERTLGAERLEGPVPGLPPVEARLGPPALIASPSGEAKVLATPESQAQAQADGQGEVWHQARLLARCQPRARSAAQTAHSRNRARQAGLLAHQAHASALALQVLSAAFSRTHAEIGTQRFGRMAQAFWRAFGPQHGDLNAWGGGLPEFIEGSPELQAWPYLPDLARLEWACVQAAGAPDPPPGLQVSSLLELGRASAESVRLAAAPGAVFLPTKWRLLQAQPSPLPVDGPEGGIWVWRRGLEVLSRQLEPPEQPWLQALSQGGSLAHLMQQAQGHAHAEPFEAWLPKAVQSGWVLGLLKQGP